MSRPIQEHPDYHDGFFDALDGEPLFEGECSPEYEAGWRAYWSAWLMLNDEPDALPADPMAAGKYH